MEQRKQAPKRGLMGEGETTMVRDPNQTLSGYHVTPQGRARDAPFVPSDHPNVNANASAPGSRNSMSNWRSPIGFG